MYFPSLKIQLNYTATISLTRERSVLQLSVIFVIIKFVSYSKLQKRGWLIKGVSYVSGEQRYICEITNLHISQNTFLTLHSNY